MERRQNNGRRYQIVREFVKNIRDDTTRMVCFLYVNGYKDGEIHRTLRIGKPRLKQIKDQLAFDLLKAGIQNTEQPISAQERRSESEPEYCPAENVSDSA